MTPPINKTLLFRTPRFDVYHEERLCPNGIENHYYLAKPDAVLIVPHTMTHVILLASQRPTIGTLSFELPGGRIEKEEDPFTAARRELKEECGVTSEEWIHAATSFPLPSVTTEKVHIFFARLAANSFDGTAGWQKTENIVALHWKTFDQVRGLALNAEVRCAVDAYALLLFLETQSTCRKDKANE